MNGATEGMIAAMLGLLDPGDEVIVFEPFYENYGPDAILTGAVAALRDAPRARLVDRSRRAAGRGHARGPGRSSSTRRTTRRARCSAATSWSSIAGLCREHDLLAFTDDIYQHLVYEGEHIPLATLPGMARADRLDRLDVEDVLGDRLAGRLGDRLARR